LFGDPALNLPGEIARPAPNYLPLIMKPSLADGP
jgi:hypothetical protein